MTVFAVVSHLSIRALATGYILGSIGVGVPLFLIVNSQKRWLSRAHRLALQSGIDLPSRLEDRITRRLRNEWLSSLVFYPLISVPLLFLSFNIALRGATFWATWFPRLAMLLPIFGVIISFSTVIVARWSIPGPTRLSHFRKVRLREAFTPAETYTLMAGIGATGAVIAWGLSQVHSPIHWWVFEFCPFALAGVLWWLMDVAVLHHHSTASDAKELEWDDVFRFRRVRSLAIGAAWLPPTLGVFLDFLMNERLPHFQHGTVWPMYVTFAVGAGVYMIFRQGRQLWRMV
jgi:hypothetical protein